MPAPEDPSDNGDDDGAVPPAIVRAMSDDIVATPTGASNGRLFLGAIDTPSADVVWDSEPIARPPNLSSSIPLCDSARLERSGVLLA